MNEYPQSQGISTTTQCYDCLRLDDICDICMEEKETRDNTIAWELVDDGNLQYKRVPSYLKKEPSSHDWTDRDGEYLEPTVKLQDGGMLDNLELLDEYAQSKREQECHWCHLLTPKIYNDCQACDKPLEHNLITAV